ncbi:hypothetical protein PAT3040_03986 [Paenibacillus agaridevorans]|uniref:Teneurin-like YD-shell domain-containing protein n=1 Tax=Paenibacillus agaridevorans TaxID=171404 RepID=A0A2R5ERN5_9BACL|nr:RHS repeat-associated core domain-containing protein [Paenibacillus agaridevorans]GBG09342.1 hypothetical protein PAT3040_03986 [Paenibacillus agaridevorans]
MKKIILSLLSMVLFLTSSLPLSPAIAEGGNNRNETQQVVGDIQFELEQLDWLNAPVEAPIEPELGETQPETTAFEPQLVTTESNSTNKLIDEDQLQNTQMMAMNGYTPDPSILSALNNINIRMPQSPYSIDTIQESISTLNGNLSVGVDDLSLPGRNGLSFTLKRYYDASNAGFMEQNVYPKIFCVCKVTFNATQHIQRVYNFDYNNIYDDPTSYRPGRYEYSPMYVTDGTMNNIIDATGWATFVSDRSTSGESIYSAWSAPDPNMLNMQIRFATFIPPNNDMTFDAGQNTFLMGWGNQAKEKTFEEKLYPIGKGWMWNIPFIKTIEGKRYLNMQDGGTYEISGTSLKGYPFQDLSIAYNGSVVVNGEASNTVLKSIKGPDHYFALDGRLIRIADRYDNTIDFHYSNHTTYGKVLTSIKDAIGNTITISYDANQVVLTQGNKTVRYNKYEYTTYDPLPPFRQLKTEILSSVVDPLNRTTSYGYSFKDSAFSLVDSIPSKNNKTAYLTNIYHPTGAATSYTYENSPVNRKIGMNAVQNAYRVSSRKDVASGVTYNLRSFTYTNPQGGNTDYASNYGQNISNFFVNISDGLTTTVFDHRKRMANENDIPQFYTNKVTVTAGDEHRITTYQYDETRRIPFPIQTNEQFKKGTATAPSVQTSVTYDNFGNVLTSTNPLGVTTTYTYDPTTRLLASIAKPVKLGESRYTKYDRNPQGSITQMTVRQNNDEGVMLAQVKYENFDSHGNSRRVIVTDDDRLITYETEFNAASPYLEAFPTKQTIATKNYLGHQELVSNEITYDTKRGVPLSSSDGNGNRTYYQYDHLDRLIKITNHDNSFTTAVYTDGSAQQVIITDETGVKTRMRWDRLGNLMDEAVLDGSYRIIRSYGYDAYERKSWEKDNLQRTTAYEYDAWSRIKKVTNPDNSNSTIDYDEINKVEVSTDPAGNKWRNTADILGQIVLTEEWKEGQFRKISSAVYDFEGNVLSQSNATDTTTYAYDVLGQLTKLTDALNKEYVYEYSLAGMLKTIKYPDGNQILKEYDELGRLIEQTNEVGLKDKYSYDLSSNLTTHIDRKNQTFEFEYNNRNFLTKKKAPDEIIDFTYDAAGRRKTMKIATESEDTEFLYKPSTGELIRVTFPDNKFISYTYNSLGLRSTMTDPFGSVTYYTYDNRNRLTGVGPSLTNQDVVYTYYSNNLLKDSTLKNGNKSIMTYDGLRLKTKINQKADGTQLQSFTNNYDENGNITNSIDNQSGITINKDFTYDPLSRVKSASQFNEAYTYDSRDNRLTLQTEQQLGNLAMSDVSYLYDSQNRLIQATVDEDVVSYRYNGDGMLYERTENDITTRYYYDGPNIIAEGTVTSEGTTMNARFIRGIQLIARQDVSSKSYYLHNGHGDVIELRDSTGNLSLNSYSYDIWGNLLTESETVANPFRYSGEFWDSTTELQYLRARWYDPSIGRFINKDTFEGELNNPLSLNSYTYAHNNPLRYSDPTGHYCVSADGNFAHEGACSNLETSYWFPDEDNQPIISYGFLLGSTGKNRAASAASYSKNLIKMNYWKSFTKPAVRNPGPLTTTNAKTNKPNVYEVKDLGSQWGKFSSKLEFNTSKIGAYTSFAVYGNGVEMQFQNGYKLRVEFSFANVEMGFYANAQTGQIFIGYEAAGGKADITLLQPAPQLDYYLAYNVSVSVVTYGASASLNNGIIKFHIGFGEGGVGFGIGITK